MDPPFRTALPSTPPLRPDRVRGARRGDAGRVHELHRNGAALNCPRLPAARRLPFPPRAAGRCSRASPVVPGHPSPRTTYYVIRRTSTTAYHRRGRARGRGVRCTRLVPLPGERDRGTGHHRVERPIGHLRHRAVGRHGAGDRHPGLVAVSDSGRTGAWESVPPLSFRVTAEHLHLRSGRSGMPAPPARSWWRRRPGSTPPSENGGLTRRNLLIGTAAAIGSRRVAAAG